MVCFRLLYLIGVTGCLLISLIPSNEVNEKISVAIENGIQQIAPEKIVTNPVWLRKCARYGPYAVLMVEQIGDDGQLLKDWFVCKNEQGAWYLSNELNASKDPVWGLLLGRAGIFYAVTPKYMPSAQSR
jgi:hypothetical protein